MTLGDGVFLTNSKLAEVTNLKASFRGSGAWSWVQNNNYTNLLVVLGSP